MPPVSAEAEWHDEPRASAGPRLLGSDGGCEAAEKRARAAAPEDFPGGLADALAAFDEAAGAVQEAVARARRLFALAGEHLVAEQRELDARRDEELLSFAAEREALACARQGLEIELAEERRARRGSEAASTLVSPQLSLAHAEAPVDSGQSSTLRDLLLPPMARRGLLLDGRCAIDRDGVVFGTAGVLAERLVLVGGWTGLGAECLRGVQQLEPGAPEFAPGPQLAQPRAGCAAVELDDGRLLVAGGFNAAGALRGTELLAPSGPAVPGPPLSAPRAGCAAVRLGSGRILVAGGFDEHDSLDTTDVLDPSAAAFEPGPRLTRPRGACAAVRLPDGRVLVVGGVSGSEHLASTELLDAAGAAFSPGPDMLTRRAGCAIAALDAGRVLVAGGFDGERNLDSTEVLDVASLSFAPGPRLGARRAGCAAWAARGDGSRVLVVGGFDGSGNLDSTEALDPSVMAFVPGPALCARQDAEEEEPSLT